MGIEVNVSANTGYNHSFSNYNSGTFIRFMIKIIICSNSSNVIIIIIILLLVLLMLFI